MLDDTKGQECNQLSHESIDIQDQLLLKRAMQRKDRRALEILHAKYYHQIKRFVASRIGSVTDVEDVVQNVFLELCKDSIHYNVRQTAEAYLLGITRHLIARHFRKRKERVEIVSIESIAANQRVRPNQNKLEHISTRDLKKLIRNALRKLTPKAAEAVKLRLIDGLSSKQAAQKAGCSLDTFHRRLERATKSLQHLIGKKPQSGYWQ
jgi:RNA polymerase sigma-70 factor (ECF subfamily)